jgi:hypothetical protein
MAEVKSRPIAPAEVREWFKSPRMPPPSDEVCDEIAAHLTRMRWPSDPSDDPDSPWLPKQEADTNQWWDFKGATDAANMLLAGIPAMLSHWEQLQWAPETQDGYAVIESLRDALSHALPYIEV